MNNRVAFIIPYFGKFNNYFPLFLKSCEANADFCDWLIYTDDKTEYKYPNNVKVYYLKWSEMQDIIKRKFEGKFCIERPYKLCDYKPAYGYLFSEYLSGYSFWGHCDVDLIWGKISDFLSVESLMKFDKTFDLGHCTIFQNNSRVNEAFMLEINGKKRYEEVYRNKKNCSFDEEYYNESINDIFIENGLTIFEKSFAANTYTKTSNFRLTNMSHDKRGYEVEKKSNGLFVWNRGKIIRYCKINGFIEEKEYLYIHFQSRPMDVKNFDLVVQSDVFKLIPNKFEPLEVREINNENFEKIKKKHFNMHYFKLRWKNLIIKIKSRIRRG